MADLLSVGCVSAILGCDRLVWMVCHLNDSPLFSLSQIVLDVCVSVCLLLVAFLFRCMDSLVLPPTSSEYLPSMCTKASLSSTGKGKSPML